MSCFESFHMGAPSEYSIRSKAQIDALFDDSRSMCSSGGLDWQMGPRTITSMTLSENCCFSEDANTDESGVNGMVQARIEELFASVDVEETEAESEEPLPTAAVLQVEYLGAAPVGGRIASVRGLQEPLRQLVEKVDGSGGQKAELEISRLGLTYRLSSIEDSGSGTEKTSPFRRIAVWSALRLKSRRRGSDLLHAFVPLVATSDKRSEEVRYAELYRTMRGLSEEVCLYPPIFAVVMRRPGASRLLECHAFSCKTEEDAVAAAATLYRVLLSDFEATRRRPRQKNGIGRMSIASGVSLISVPASTKRKPPSPILIPPPPPMQPIKPPRTKKLSASSTEDENSSICSNIVTIEKAPRRRKKMSEIFVKSEYPADKNSPKTNINVDSNTHSNRESEMDEKVILIHRTNEEASSSASPPSSPSTSSSSPGVASQSETTSSKRQKDEGPSSNVYEETKPKSRQGSYDFGNNSGNDVGDGDKINNSNNSIKSCSDRSSTKNNKKESEMMKAKMKRSLCRADRRNKLLEEMYQQRKIANIYHGNDDKRYRGGCAQDDFGYNHEDHIEMIDDIYESNYSQIIRNPPKLNQPFRGSDNFKSRSSRRLTRIDTMDHPFRKIPPSVDLFESQACDCRHQQRDVRSRRRAINSSNNNYSGSDSCRGYSSSNKPHSQRAGSEPPRSRTEEICNNQRNSRIKRSQSDMDLMLDRAGDPLTRVELPRRGSFLNPGSIKRQSNVEGGTPLGFSELFDEFRNQEGLTNVDEILSTIIDPEGMSFNDLKPLYKEFLMKLATTLTQDELYQRSASIMRRRRRPQRRRSTRRPCLLRRAIKRSVSRLKSGPTEFTSVIFPAAKLNDSFGSSSSCEAKTNLRGRAIPTKTGNRKKSSKGTCKTRNQMTTSDDSDNCRKLSRSIIAANRSSSGYVSCSECSYDSETCTCVSADKCYCSLPRRVPVEIVNDTGCSCDTDSCSESNKCYCVRKPNVQPTILEQLRLKGIVPSESTLSRDGSINRSKSIKNGRNLTASKSLEYLQVRSASARGSSDNLALDYDLFRPGRGSGHSSNSEKVLVVSARDPKGRLIYVGGTERNKKISNHQRGRTNVHHEALSIKKSAEIAAIFSSSHPRISARTSSVSSLQSCVSLEAGLGYLP